MKRSRAELDATVVNIELTLVSIIQGVALYFLTENARTILSERNWAACIYVAAGLLVIFVFWSRSVIHTLTLIKWPLEFGHNFFYIACALGEAILFTCVGQPLDWFCPSTIYSGIVWLLFVYDMRLIRARLNEPHSPAEHTPFIFTPDPISCSTFRRSCRSSSFLIWDARSPFTGHRIFSSVAAAMFG